MPFYDEMQGIADGLLKQFNQGIVQYVDSTPGNGPPDNPGEPIETVTKLDAVVRGVEFKYVNNSTIVTTDLQTVFSARNVAEPKIDGFIIVDGLRCKILQLIPIPPAGEVVAWKAIFRG